jgi:hypothetical protein
MAVQHRRCKTPGFIKVTRRPAKRADVNELVVMVLCFLGLCGIVLCVKNRWDHQDRQNSHCDCQDEVSVFHNVLLEFSCLWRLAPLTGVADADC